MAIRDELTFRPADVEKDLDYAYAELFRPGIEKAVRELTGEFNRAAKKGPAEGEWPESRYAFFKKGFSDPDMMMISHKGRDVGCFCISNTEEAIVLQRVYLLPEYQRQGIGQRLIDMSLDKARQLKKPLELEVLANNTQAINAYTKAGFEPCSDVIVNGWNKKFTMRHKDTVQYLPAPALLPVPRPVLLLPARAGMA